jgi:hypothetical protein
VSVGGVAHRPSAVVFETRATNPPASNVPRRFTPSATIDVKPRSVSHTPAKPLQADAGCRDGAGGKPPEAPEISEAIGGGAAATIVSAGFVTGAGGTPAGAAAGEAGATAAGAAAVGAVTGAAGVVTGC